MYTTVKHISDVANMIFPPVRKVTIQRCCRDQRTVIQLNWFSTSVIQSSESNRQIVHSCCSIFAERNISCLLFRHEDRLYLIRSVIYKNGTAFQRRSLVFRIPHWSWLFSADEYLLMQSSRTTQISNFSSQPAFPCVLLNIRIQKYFKYMLHKRPNGRLLGIRR